MLRVAAALSALALALAPGCSSGKCGAGTVRYGDECLVADPFDKTPPNLTIDPPLYTRQVGTVRITSDKPATIYYTLDGNPPTTDSKSGADEIVIPNVPDDGAVLRTFAIDLAGNRSQEVVRVWVIDREGPGSPADFHLTLAADQSTRTVTWSMPSDPRPGGVLVARVDTKAGIGPVSGQTYKVGDELAPGVTVVGVFGTDPRGSFTESMAAGPGLVRYMAWAFDDLNNYGPPAADYAVVPMTAQTATVTIDQATGATTVSGPATLGMFASATVTTTPAPVTLSLNLSIKNTTTRPLFAPKLMVTNAASFPVGLNWNSDGMIGTVPYKAYGPALSTGASNTETWTFSGTGITGTGTFTLQLSFRDDPVLTTVSPRDIGPPIVDSATGQDVGDMPAGSPGKGSTARSTISAFTPDGNLVVAQRESCKVILENIGAARQVASVSLCSDTGHVPWLVTDHGGAVVYAVIANERPKRQYHVAPCDTQLVRLDAATLTEYGPRLSLGQSMTRTMRMSPDDKTIIIATGVTSQGVLVIDTTTFKITNQIIPSFKVQAVALAPDAKTIAAVGDSQVGIYDLGGNLIEKRALPGVVSTGSETRVMATFSSAQKLWIARIGELDSLDLQTGDSETFNYTGTVVEVIDGKLYTRPTYYSMGRFDLAGNQEMDMPGLNTRYGHWIGRSPF